MRKLAFKISIGLLLISCEHKADQQALQDLFSRTTYDTTVIQKLFLYDSIKNIVINNIDTIFKFRNNRNIVTYTDEKGKIIQKHENSYTYTFDKDYGHATQLSYGTEPDNQKLIADVNLENMPKFIFLKVDSLFAILRENNIKGFSLSIDSAIEINIKDFYDQKTNADVYHTLIWKRIYVNNIEPDLFVKDTTLAQGWIYQIWVEAHRGW